jgi:uncharacterized protein (DUF1501 family)
VGLGSAAFFLRDLLLPAPAAADPAELATRPLLIFAYFGGGWDTLMCLDPRDNTKFNDPQKGIQTGYDLLAQNEPRVDAILQQGTHSGLVKPAGSNIAFGPAMGNLAAHFQDLCVVRGIEMATLTHEVGRRYFLTGKFPRGLAASGSALPTWVVHDDPGAAPIPNLVVGGVETYNEGLDPQASGLSIRNSGDLGAILKPLVAGLEPSAAAEQAIEAYQAKVPCIQTQLDPDGLATAYRASMQSAKVFAGGSLFPHFNFVANPMAGGEIDKLYSAFNINPAAPAKDLAGPKGQVAIAAQALVNNISQAVSIEPAAQLDTHDDTWQTDHAPTLLDGFDALADLITFLKSTNDPNGKPYWDRTVLFCFSEFARGPVLNARGGRDHHLFNACLVGGKGIAGNKLIGATADADYASTAIDLATGLPSMSGVKIRPADVHATVLTAMGLPYDHIKNQSPQIIQAMLKP